jgi:hypothetical protein
MKNNIRKIFYVILLTFAMLATNTAAIKITGSSDTDKEILTTNLENDIDPLIDLEVTVTIKEIRAFDKIDLFTDPDFYVKLFINEHEFTSDIWHNQKYVKEEWKKTVDVPDDIEYVNITIQLWDWNYGFDKQCDIARNDNENTNRRDITVYYSLKTGHWVGHDEITLPDAWYADYSGYGRANGCDDNSIYEKDRDCEILFDISQNDYDNDGIPYWTETNIYNKTCQCNPLVDDTGDDEDGDGIPIEWEHKWGFYLKTDYNHTTHEHTIEYKWRYHPFEWNDHENLDPDADSINNYEEYLTSNWGSDPFRKDIFVELDQMKGKGEIPDSLLPQGSKDLIQDAFNRQNIVIHFDDGSWGEGSESDMIPFDDEGPNTTREEINDMYNHYFLKGDENNWRKGVFHYGLVIYNATYHGFAFRNNAFQISRKGMEIKAKNPFLANRDIVYASAYMHELGHTLGLNWLLGHQTPQGYNPKYLLWWKTRAYKSIMNYGYMYGLFWNKVDFSDGSRGKNDFDDWSNIVYDYFEE